MKETRLVPDEIYRLQEGAHALMADALAILGFRLVDVAKQELFKPEFLLAPALRATTPDGGLRDTGLLLSAEYL